MRYRSWRSVVEHENNAVIIYMMDVSGSMGDEQKEIVRIESFWIDAWLRHQYKGLQCRYLIHDAVAASLSSLPQLLRSRRLAWETLRHGTSADDGSEFAVPAAELLAVAVEPSWRGRHVGAQLVDGFLGELDRRRVTHAQVVVGADNATAITLYRAHGFLPDHTFELHRGTPSLVMRRGPGDRTP